MNKNYKLFIDNIKKEREKFHEERNNQLKAFIHDLETGQKPNNNIDLYYPYYQEDMLFRIIRYLCDENLEEITKQYEVSKIDMYNLAESHEIDIKSKNSIIKISANNQQIIAHRLSGNFKGISSRKYYSIKNNSKNKNLYKHLIELSKNLNYKNSIVTGYIYGISPNDKKLHSWIEFKKKNEDYVIDFINNLVINKSGYYYLTHAEKLNEVSSEILKSDEIIYNEFNKILNLSEQEYLIFRDFIIKDLEKNKSLVLK